MTTLPTYNHPAPARLLAYFEGAVHSGRGTGHLNALTDSILPALAAHPKIAPAVIAGEITYYAGARQGDRGIDLILGRPGHNAAVFDSVVGMYAGRPEKVEIAGRYTSIMTEHAKAQRNRREDFLRFADKCHREWGADVVRFGVCPVNASDSYYSHTAKGMNMHGNGAAKAARALDILRQIPMREEIGSEGLDALWTPVVVTNNATSPEHRQVDWLRQYPQPGDDQPFSFSWFIERIASAYDSRFRS